MHTRILGQHLQEALKEYYLRRHPDAAAIVITGPLAFMTMLSPTYHAGDVEIEEQPAAPEKVHDLTIGNLAACSLGFDAGAAKEMGLEVLYTTKTTTVLRCTPTQAADLLAELDERADRYGEGWNLEASERAACRRAAASIRQALGAP